MVIANTAPAKTAKQGWRDASGGNIFRYDATYLNDWVPVGEPKPSQAYQGLALGRATVNGYQAVAIGAGTNAIGPVP